VVRDWTAQVVVQFLEDVLQRRRRRHARLDGKAQPVGLSGPMIRVLAQDAHLCLGVRRVMQGVENVVHVRVNRARPVLFNQEPPQLLVVGLLELVRQPLAPVVLQNRSQRRCTSASFRVRERTAESFVRTGTEKRRHGKAPARKSAGTEKRRHRKAQAPKKARTEKGPDGKGPARRRSAPVPAEAPSAVLRRQRRWVANVALPSAVL